MQTFTEDDLAKDAASAKPRNPTLGSSKGFGFVAFETHEEAKSAAEKLNNTVVPDPEGRRPTIAASALKAAEEALAKASEDGKEAPAELVEKVAEAKKAAEEEATADVTKTLFVGQAQKKEERQREMRKKFQMLREKKMQSYMGVNLFVKNLDDSVDDKQLDAAFSQYGTITSSRVMRNPDGSSKGFGFVCYSAPEEATAASNDMNGKPFAGKPIFVALAQRREQRREMLSAAHMPQGRGPQGGPGMPRGPMGPGGADMYGPMGAMGMYKQYPGGPGYGMPQMMMQGGRGMPRGPGMPYNQRGQGGGYQVCKRFVECVILWALKIFSFPPSEWLLLMPNSGLCYVTCLSDASLPERSDESRPIRPAGTGKSPQPQQPASKQPWPRPKHAPGSRPATGTLLLIELF